MEEKGNGRAKNCDGKRRCSLWIGHLYEVLSFLKPLLIYTCYKLRSQNVLSGGENAVSYLVSRLALDVLLLLCCVESSAVLCA